MVSESTKSCSGNRETCHFSLVREFVKILNIVREFVNRTPPEGSLLKFLNNMIFYYFIRMICHMIYVLCYSYILIVGFDPSNHDKYYPEISQNTGYHDKMEYITEKSNQLNWH